MMVAIRVDRAFMVSSGASASFHGALLDFQGAFFVVFSWDVHSAFVEFRDGSVVLP